MSQTLDLFGKHSNPTKYHSELNWPDKKRFPLNIDQRRVEDPVLADLKKSDDPLIIAGYASLDRLIEFICSRDESQSARILIGFEPFTSRQQSFELNKVSLDSEMEAFWLEQGISILLSAKLLLAIKRLKEGQIQSRYYAGRERLHAKIYCGDDAITVGSSNFTEPGLVRQLEANVRFDKKKEPVRYQQTKVIAENYWKLGKAYNAKLIKLLEQLLKLVPWREALARACAELLEGEWAKRFLSMEHLTEDAKLWPSQEKGIAQALYIISRHDSVLLADATGAGKTRMGVYLIQSLVEQIVRSNRKTRGKTILVCPPAVEETWMCEGLNVSASLDIYSHGTLSHHRSRKHELSLEALRRAQILAVDEGHNFLNFASSRSRHLLQNLADHLLLFTATPINKSAADLLRMADLLGGDNLAESTVETFRKVLGGRSIKRSLSEQEISLLREEIQRFTVRRTKSMLNAMIKKEPEKYRDKAGRKCRFPKHKALVYKLKESVSDCRFAEEISSLADQLHAVAFFQKDIEMPEYLKRKKYSELKYLQGRLASMQKIARYFITSSLRSSRAALSEHIAGTNAAREKFGLDDFKRTSSLKGMINKLETISGKVPKNKLNISLPDWLEDKNKHRQACEHDKKIYKEILNLVYRISDMRETQKALKLKKLLDKHNLILAFDSRPITLADLQSRLSKISGKRPTIIVATGETSSDRRGLLDSFQLGSIEKNIIGLCSDSMSEGVNLQQASAMVHLDVPSVVRIAEQRVGRIDRLDSRFESIEAWWPEDAPAFSLASDERFIERYETVDNLLGANMPLPDEFRQSSEKKKVPVRELIKEYDKQIGKVAWDGIHDAFDPVRHMVSGSDAILPESTYERYRKVTSRVMSRVSLVKATQPWAFFAISSGVFGAPRWILLPGFNRKAQTELAEVAKALRERLTDEVIDVDMSSRAEDYLRRFLRILSREERHLLSRKKQKALVEMELILKSYLKSASVAKDQKKIEAYGALIGVLENPDIEAQPDWDEVAARWLDLIRPVWYENLKEGKKRLLLLKDIRKELLTRESDLGGKIIKKFSEFPVLPPPDKRISACILGIS